MSVARLEVLVWARTPVKEERRRIAHKVKCDRDIIILRSFVRKEKRTGDGCGDRCPGVSFAGHSTGVKIGKKEISWYREGEIHE